MRTEDGHIVFKCLEGDPAAFGLLVDKYKGSIFALAYSKLGNFHDAEDVTQEVFIKAYRKLKTLKNRDNFLAWLYAITSNLCKDWFRSRERRFNHEIVEEEIDRISMESYRDDKACELLNDALDSLPDAYRQVLMLYYLGGMDGKEIARFLGTSQNAIMLRLSRARLQLREEMVTMMRDTYEAQKLSVSFTFRIVEIIKRITIHSTPRTPWISWGVSLTAGLIFTVLSLSSPQTSFNPLKDFSALSGKMGIMDVEWLPSVNQNSHNVNINAEISVEPLVVSKGLKGIALAGSGKGDESKTETPSQTNIPAVTGNVEMQTVSGKVLKDDKPVSNAQVYVYPYGTQNKYEGMTEKDGTFKIKVPKPDDNFLGGVVVAFTPGSSFNLAETTKDKTSDIIIKLRKPLDIAGIVLGNSDKPIDDIEVKIVDMFSSTDFGSAYTYWVNGDFIPDSVAKTDSNGKFIFHNLPEGSKIHLNITKQGYARGIKDSISAGIEGKVIKLKPEARIEGKVTFGNTGKPAKDIEIYAWGIYPTDQNSSAITDDNGYYAITNLNAGQYDVLYQAKDNEWTTTGNDNIKVTEGQTLKDVNFKLIKGGLITGKVLNEGTNEPIQNFWIGMFDKSSPEQRGSSAGATTDKDGNFQLRATPGKVKVYIRTSQEYEPVGTIEKVVDVVEGGTVSDINFTVKKLEIFSVKGSVFTSDGEPVADAVIKEWYIPLAVSDKDGKFTISGLRRRQKLVVKAEQKELHLRGTTEVQIPYDEDIEIITEQYETTSVNGRVVNRKGEPIASADIMILIQDIEGVIGNSAGISDSSGNYKIDNLIVGDKYSINAKADGYREADTETFTATKDMKPLPDIVLDTAGTYFLEGIVKDTNGNPITGARVSNNDTFSTTDENGHYRLENLFRMVEIEIDIDHSDYGHSVFRYVATNGKHDFVLVKADGYLAGKVIDADGNPIQDAGIFVESGLPSSWESSGHVNTGARADTNGHFQLSHLLINKKAYIGVSSNKERLYKLFKDVEMNRDDVVFTLKEESAEPPKPPTAEEIEKRKYNEDIEKRANEIVDKPVPELDVDQWIAGKPVDLSELKGKVVVLHFWSYFREDGNNNVEDKSNLETIRFLNALQKAYSDKGVVFVSIHGYTQRIDELKKVVKEWDPVYNIAVDKKSPIKWSKGMTFDKFGNYWPPFLLINRDGTVKYQAWDSELEGKIKELVSD